MDFHPVCSKIALDLIWYYLSRNYGIVVVVIIVEVPAKIAEIVKEMICPFCFATTLLDRCNIHFNL